jgi:hypothetical protein
MNRKQMKNLLLGVAAAALLAPTVRADSLTVTLTEPSQTVVQGTTVVTFDATILNPSLTDTIFLNGDSSSTNSFLVSVDDTPFLLNAPISLGPGTSSGPFALFNVDLPGNLAPGVYTGIFSILGGPDGGAGTDFLDLGAVDFTVDVTSPVVTTPEPGILFLLCSGLGLVAVRYRRCGLKI